MCESEKETVCAILRERKIGRQGKRKNYILYSLLGIVMLFSSNC